MNSTTKVGRQAELIAKEHLQRHGLRFLIANYHCRRGEIDLIMEDNKQLVFIEVKYRRCHHFGSGIETVSHTKQQRIIFTAQHFLHRHHMTEKVSSRFDIVSIDNQVSNDTPTNQRILWLKNAFY